MSRNPRCNSGRALPGRRPLTLALSAVLAQGLWLPSLQAQSGDEETARLDEVTVTATRRAESVQDVPLNISALSGDSLREEGVSSLVEIGRSVPGLYVLDQGGRGANAIIVRGLNADPIAASEALGNGGGGTVATYVGEIPLYVDLRLEDIERVEVLLGPQGTLYGAGTLGGAIRYLPKRPSFDGVELQARSSLYDLAHSGSLGYTAGFTANLPISETLAFRATIDYLDDPGFIDYDYLVRDPGVSDPEPNFNDPADVAANLRRREDADFQQTLSGRLGLRLQPNEAIDINLTYYFQDQEVGGRTQNHALAFGTGEYVSAHRFEEPSDRRNELLALEIVADLGFAELTSATGVSSYDENGQRDQTDLLITLEYSYEAFPSFSAFTREDQEDDTFNQELRLVSTGEGPLSWIVGGFYNELEVNAESREFTPGYPEYLGGSRPDNLEYFSVNKTDLTEKAIYGELSYEFTDRWTVTVGARYYKYDLETQDAVDFPLFNSIFGDAGPTDITLDFQPGGQSDSGSLFKFNTAYRFSEDVLGYFTISEGYRIGNSNGVAPCPDPLPDNQIACGLPDELQFFPDKTTNFELGLRSQWFDRRLTVNGAVYFIDWEDPQLAGTTENAALPITKNGKGAESRGVELSFDALLSSNFSLRGSVAYTQAELSEDAPALLNTISGPGFSPRIDVDGLAGDRLPGSPEWQGNLYLTYDTTVFDGLDLRLNYGLSAIGDVLTRTGNRADGERLGGYSVHNAAASLRGLNWSVQLYAENIWDKYAVTGVRSSRAFIQTVSDENGDPVTVRRYYQDVLRPREIGLRFVYDFEL
ncbi:MAG: TonB-dependent receptor [Xanthomonadales bacterium]|nr:TonB-dependent receptor [Xanthomonadales bacterium]